MQYIPGRIRDPIPPPTSCPYCQAPVEYVNNAKIYGRAFGRWPFSWACTNRPACGASVGCHPGTDVPLGTLANWPTKRARSRAHEAFDPLWDYEPILPPKKLDSRRRAAYSWLASQLGIPLSECHIGMFDQATAERVVELCLKREMKR